MQLSWLVDGITFPNNIDLCGPGGKMVRVKADINGKIWVTIDLGVSKTVRSLYLAVPEHLTHERL